MTVAREEAAQEPQHVGGGAPSPEDGVVWYRKEWVGLLIAASVGVSWASLEWVAWGGGLMVVVSTVAYVQANRSPHPNQR